MALVTSSVSLSWSIHDSWTEAFVGTRKLVYELLPSTTFSAKAEDGALCQLALVGANHLMEIAIYKILLPHTKATGQLSILTQKLLEQASYHSMLTDWLPTIAGTQLNLQVEPLLSTETLRKRRNKTIHKSSALATVEMAKAALYAAVHGTKAFYHHSGTAFPYVSFLQKYPLENEPWFSSIKMP